MQDQRAEPDRRGSASATGRLVGSGVGMALAAGAAAAVWLSRSPFVPSWLECGRGTVLAAKRLHEQAPVLAVATAAAAVLLLWALPWLRRRVDTLGLAAVAVFASGTVLLAGDLLLHFGATLPRLLEPTALWSAAAVALPLSVSLAPLCCDRGLSSLVMVPAIAVCGALIAMQSARDADAEAAAVRALQTAAPTSSPVALVLPEDTPRELVNGLVAALRRPAHAIDLDVYTIPPDGIESSWLQRMGVDRLRVRGSTVDVLPGAHSNQRLAAGVLRLDAGFAGPGPRDGLFVRSGRELAHCHTCVFTPYGCLHGELGDNGVMALPAATEQQLRAIVAALPSGAAIRVLVVSPAEADAYGWLDLLLP
jgi:hypothetical protein